MSTYCAVDPSDNTQNICPDCESEATDIVYINQEPNRYCRKHGLATARASQIEKGV